MASAALLQKLARGVARHGHEIGTATVVGHGSSLMRRGGSQLSCGSNNIPGGIARHFWVSPGTGYRSRALSSAYSGVACRTSVRSGGAYITRLAGGCGGRTFVLFAAAGFSLSSLACLVPENGDDEDDGTGIVVERATGIEFMQAMTMSKVVNGTREFVEHRLLGTGCRYKYGLVKVYAVGLYAHKVAVRGIAGEALKKAAKNGKLADALLRPHEQPFDKAIVIKMYRGVSTETMVQAIADALKPRMAKDTNQTSSDARMDALGSFKEMLLSQTGGDQLPAGCELSFVWTTANVLQLFVKRDPCPVTRRIGEVENVDLCMALFDTYLGADAVCPDAKKEVEKTFGL